ncbi:MAG: hypothetical protein C4541_05695 [Candidatus Auribacter fodinae]|jgi:predicted  nucleic acid-binding Zn-ribbon protein|uniref:Uncharacterized protein n=1 Tax=Candidatus Auribacter fodinae TaxID=2093366 RepID=A0A3A4R9R5_9BACT|nr:MAG: hypothetical protein C4541_05695 [Candidatus Auribacter fodinae]
MIKQLFLLRDLQEIDLRIFTLRKKQTSLPENLQSLKKDVDQKRKALDQASHKARELKVEQKSLENELESHKNTAVKYKNQSSQIKSNDQYKALMLEIAIIEKKIAAVEDAILEQMLKTESAEDEVKQAQAALKSCEERLKSGEEKINIEIQQVDEQINKIKAERNELSRKVDPKSLNLYERILQNKREELAVVPLEGNTCQGCHMKVTPNDVNEVHKGHRIVICENCSRILYSLPESI